MTTTSPRPPSWDYVMAILAANALLWGATLLILRHLAKVCQ